MAESDRIGTAALASQDVPRQRWSPSVSSIERQFSGIGPVVAGEVIAHLLRDHDYVERALLQEVLSAQRFPTLGPQRTAEEHVAVAAEVWDPAAAPAITGRHVILGLALDPDVGWELLRWGIIGSLLDRWRPGRGTPEEPYRLVWDVLTDHGRTLAEDQPVLAAALGAPPESSMPVGVEPVALVWSPAGDRLAVLAGGTVLEVRPGQPPRELGRPGPAAVSIGWGARGVVVLTISGGVATLARAVDGRPLGDWSGVTAGVLSGDGSHAWLATTDGVYRWAPDETQPTRLTSPTHQQPAVPLAVDRTGHRGLLRWERSTVLVAAAVPPGTAPGDGTGPEPPWPPDAAPMVGWSPRPRPPCALVTLDRAPAVVYPQPTGLHLDRLPAPTVCRIAVDPGHVGALAVDPTGTRLAAAVGTHVAVWSLAGRLPSAIVPGYDSDLAAGTDLLDVDRDARAIAALASSRELRPPLSIGLFGDWGSGKSFLLDRIKRMLAEPAQPPGYLRHVRVVEFNAWHYAEANLWASLVDQVLAAIAPVASPVSPPEVVDATAQAQQAQQAAEEAARSAQGEAESLEKAKAVLVRRRRRAAWLAAALLALLAVAVVAAVIGGPARVLAAGSAALALLGSAAAILERVKQAEEQVNELAAAGQAGLGRLDRLLGRPEALAVEAHARELARLRRESAARQAEAARLADERDRIREAAATQPLGALLHRLSTISDYRDQLSLVTRTREHFRQVDEAIQQFRRAADDGGAGAEEPPLERVVVVIDDLDRCPPEKVVAVLEAVHVLFSFEMFVVLLAVDTRWLEQSLRMRYRQLLGRAGTADPRDYLEKIIQVPLQLLPLDEGLIRAMIAGLTGVAATVDAQPVQPVPGHEPGQVGEESQARVDGDRLVARMPRVERAPLAAQVLQISAAEGGAMAAVAPLVGTSPRTVKRFVNTYRLLKARSADVEGFDAARDGIGDHEVVAFLLALVTGHSAAAARILPALASARAGESVHAVVGAVAGVTSDELGPAAPAGRADAARALAASLATIQAWLADHAEYGGAPARRYAEWAAQVARFSFVRP